MHLHLVRHPSGICLQRVVPVKKGKKTAAASIHPQELPSFFIQKPIISLSSSEDIIQIPPQFLCIYQAADINAPVTDPVKEKRLPILPQADFLPGHLLPFLFCLLRRPLPQLQIVLIGDLDLGEVIKLFLSFQIGKKHHSRSISILHIPHAGTQNQKILYLFSRSGVFHQISQEGLVNGRPFHIMTHKFKPLILLLPVSPQDLFDLLFIMIAKRNHGTDAQKEIDQKKNGQ